MLQLMLALITVQLIMWSRSLPRTNLTLSSLRISKIVIIMTIMHDQYVSTKDRILDFVTKKLWYIIRTKTQTGWWSSFDSKKFKHFKFQHCWLCTSKFCFRFRWIKVLWIFLPKSMLGIVWYMLMTSRSELDCHRVHDYSLCAQTIGCLASEFVYKRLYFSLFNAL
jgi:hypothetical protein